MVEKLNTSRAVFVIKNGRFWFGPILTRAGREANALKETERSDIHKCKGSVQRHAFELSRGYIMQPSASR